MVEESVKALQKKKPAIFEIIFGIALKTAEEVFLDSKDNVFVRLKKKYRNWPQVMNIASQEYSDFLLKVSRITKRGISWNIINMVIAYLRAEARDRGIRYDLNLRSYFDQDILWYDLGEWKAIKIASDHWEIVSYPPPMFMPIMGKREKQCLPSLDHSKEGDSHTGYLDRFIGAWGLDDSDRLLVKVFLITSFLPHIIHPILILHGPHESGKTFLLKYLKSLVDPMVEDMIAGEVTYSSVISTIAHHYCVCIDNLNFVPRWLCDLLCAAVTGASHIERKYYHNTGDDSVSFSMQRKFIISCINMNQTRSDFLSRCLFVNIKTIAPSERLREDLMDKWFFELKPFILNNIFTLISQAIPLVGKLQLERLPRMAAFASWGESLARIMGHQEGVLIEYLFDQITRIRQTTLEESPLAQLLLLALQETNPLVGTASNLLYKLNELAKKNNIPKNLLPKNNGWLVKQLKELRHDFNECGISFEQARNRSGRILTIRLKNMDETQNKGDKLYPEI